MQNIPMNKRPLVLSVLFFLSMLALLVIVYLPALHGAFVFDDEVFIRDNPMLQSPRALWHIWCDLGISDYWPIFYTTVLAELRLFGDVMIGYHLVNLVLHALNATLVVLIARRLSIFAPFLIGALFALHPVCVESVAWIMQVKTLLATSFFLLSLLFYLDFDSYGGKRRYGLAWWFFVASLLTKTHMVLHPLLALVVVAWRKGWRITRRDLGAALGLIPPALLLGVLAVRQQLLFDTYRDTPPLGPILERLLHGAGVFWFYVGKVFYPRDLMLVYPYQKWDIGDPFAYLPLLGVLALGFLALALFAFKRKGGLLAAFICLFMALAPVLGFVTIAFMRYSRVADHWQYVAVPIILVVMAAPSARWLWGCGRLGRFVAVIAGMFLLITSAMLSREHSRVFRDNETLWLDTLAKNPDAWLGHYNLGTAYLRAGKLDKAIIHLESAVRLKPDYAHALTNLGTALRDKGDMPGALERFRQALHHDNTIAQAHAGVGGILRRQGRTDEAIPYLRQAMVLDPAGTVGRFELASVLILKGEYAEAGRIFSAMIATAPKNAAAHIGLGVALAMQGDERGAEEAWREALRLDPAAREAHENLAHLFARRGRSEEAARELSLSGAKLP